MIHNTLDYKSCTINYQCEGTGEETLVLLHGFMGNLESWASLIYEYMRKIRVVAIDLLGHGESGSLGETHTMEEQADMVKAVLDALGIRKCVMCGHSMGGYITMAFAERYPQYLKGLCLMHSHALADSEKKKQDRQRMCDIVASNRAGFVIGFIPNLFAACNRVRLAGQIKDLQEVALGTTCESIIASQRGMMRRPSRVDVLQNSTFPVLFIAGRQDERISIDSILAQAALTPHCEVLLLPNAGHMSVLEERPLVSRRLLTFTLDCFSL